MKTGDSRLTFFLPFVALILLSCFPFDNPLDPESEEYVGIESVDQDGDGIGQWEDVDEIDLVSPTGGAVISTLPLRLITNKFNPDKITNYWIQISVSISDFDSSIIFSGEGFTTHECELPLGVIAHNTDYYWRAKAFDSQRWSENWSDIAHFVVDISANPPSNPTPASGEETNDTTPLLDWQNAPGAVGYHVQVNTDVDFTGIMVGEENGLTDSQFQVTTMLSDHTTYFWRVKMRNALDIWSDWSSTWNFTVNIVPPDSPSPSDGSTISDTTPLLDWESLVGASAYHLQVAADAGFIDPMVVDTPLNYSYYSVPILLSDNTTYYWRVKIQNDDGMWGDWSDTWNFTVNIPAPAIPVPNDGSTIPDTAPLLNWESVAAADGYHVQVNSNDSFTGTMVADDDTLSASQYLVQTVLTDNTSYFWHVRVKNLDGVWGDWSDTWSFTVEIPPPASPSTPTPTNGGFATNTTPRLDWEDPVGVSVYRIQVNTNSDFTGTVIADDDALSESQYQITTSLMNDSTYYWRVKSGNADGVWGDWSNTWCFKVYIFPALLAEYFFNGNAADTSTNAFHGTPYGTVATTDRFGNSDSAYSFNGVNNYIEIPHLFSKSINQLTVSAWVYPYSTDAVRHRILHHAPTNGEVTMTLSPESEYTFGVKLADQTWYSIASPNTVVVNTWVHVLGKYIRGDHIELWIDGTKVAELAVPNYDLYTLFDWPSSIGSYSPTYIKNFWNGKIDDLRVFGTALDETAILNLYGEGGWTGN